HLAIMPDAATPVAVVFVDDAGQPSYVGYPGTLRLRDTSPEWRMIVESAEAAFADGWAEHEPAAEMVVDMLAAARARGVPTFFDPGPGNPTLDNDWHARALAETRVALVNEAEASRLTGLADPLEAARQLLKLGPALVILKRGREGCVAFQPGGMHISPGIPVSTVDTTGAGDSVAAAAIYGYLRRLSLADLADLTNATGAAKVQKSGTGRNMPTLEEIRAVLQTAGRDAQVLLPRTV
ncbi:MAG: carbohydrate kinase family protein, partial [Anaerolineales bacterium]